MIRQATIKLSSLRICQRGSCRNAIPNFLNEQQAFRDAELLETQ